MAEASQFPQPEPVQKPEKKAPLHKLKKVEPQPGESSQRAFKREAVQKQKIRRRAAQAILRDAARKIDDKTREAEVRHALAKAVEDQKAQSIDEVPDETSDQSEDDTDVVFPGAVSRWDRTLAIDEDVESDKNIEGEKNLAELQVRIDKARAKYFTGLVEAVKIHGSLDAKKLPPVRKTIPGKLPWQRKEVIEDPHPGWEYTWEDVKDVEAAFLESATEPGPHTLENVLFSSRILFDKDGLNPAMLDSYSLTIRTQGDSDPQSRIQLKLGTSQIEEVAINPGIGDAYEGVGVYMLAFAPQEARMSAIEQPGYLASDPKHIKSTYYDLMAKMGLTGGNDEWRHRQQMSLSLGEVPAIKFSWSEEQIKKDEKGTQVYDKKRDRYERETITHQAVFEFSPNDNEFRRKLTEEELRQRNGKLVKDDIITTDQFISVLGSAMKVLPTAPRPPISAK